jgi:RNA polymerase sigma-70 factor (ECF subfamily)
LNRRPPENLRDADAGLMALAAKGDRAAWRALYLRHRDGVFSIARRQLGDDAAARDVTQEVFVSLFTHAKSYRPTASFMTFLRRVTANRCINARETAFTSRREGLAEEALLGVPDPRPDPQAKLEERQTAAAVQGALAALPPRQRMAVVLSRFEGLSYEEIAAALDCSVSSVESLLFRARQALVRLLSGCRPQVFGGSSVPQKESPE